ncbi:hypothetical protein ZOSMA_139G00190 [Zostera marina]|uniref:Transglycosylase SLT domain-containing protein n=1 Tax=Zostera marina TaxID=29655 RepID=A0A0K9PY40_ZOSMR|nr:hypothetical protein ZOSMA_139G00190 [Zostera marina]
MAEVVEIPSYKYWEDCIDGGDVREMWMDSDVCKEWISVGERKDHKVLLSRDPDGNTFLTQTELMAVVRIIVHRYYTSQLDPDLICAIAEIESYKQPLALQYDRKIVEPKIGIMQLLQSTAEWLYREMGYRNYNIEDNPTLLFRPFVNLYFGAAYIKWLFSYNGKERNEEFVVRAYKGGPKKARHKSTLGYFQRYLSIKQSLPPRRKREINVAQTASVPTGSEWTYWDSRVSPNDMEELWKNPDVLKEWTKTAEIRGKVRFSLDKEKRPYLSRVEVKAVAAIIISRHFQTRDLRAVFLAALAEMCSMRFINGMGVRTGLLGIDYPTALWLYNDVGCKVYRVKSVDDLYNPFVSMYFGAAFMAWLSVYEGRERTHKFIVQAYLGGPENVNIQETGPYWKKFQQTLMYYDDLKRDGKGTCMIL